MYEVEYKVELSHEEKDKLINTLVTRGFLPQGATPQHDFYIAAQESPFGGYDLKRYRREGDVYFYTEKTWENIGETLARNEIERTVSSEEFENAVASHPQSITIVKNREWFAGEYNGRALHATIDTVKFNHSAGDRYFVEAEIVIENKADVLETKHFVQVFLHDVLQTEELPIESPGMFSMAYKKL